MLLKRQQDNMLKALLNSFADKVLLTLAALLIVIQAAEILDALNQQLLSDLQQETMKPLQEELSNLHHSFADPIQMIHAAQLLNHPPIFHQIQQFILLKDLSHRQEELIQQQGSFACWDPQIQGKQLIKKFHKI